MATPRENVVAIQNEYFELFRILPLAIRDRLTRSSIEDLDHSILAELTDARLYLPGYKSKKSALEAAFDELLRAVSSFWESKAQLFAECLRDAAPFVVTLQGQWFSPHIVRHARRLCIYFDSVSVVDPIHIRDQSLLAAIVNNPKAIGIKVRLITRMAHLLRAERLARADSPLPLLIVLPDIAFNEHAEHRDADRAAQIMAARCIGESINTAEEFSDYVHTNARSLAERIPHTEPFQSLVQNVFGERVDTVFTLDVDTLSTSHASPLVDAGIEEQLIGVMRYVQSTLTSFRETIANAAVADCEPILSDRNRDVYKWLQDSITDEIRAVTSSEDHVAASALVGDDLEFLEAVSVSDLLQLRSRSLLTELRETLRMERDEYRRAIRVSPEHAVGVFAERTRDIILEFSKEVRETERSTVKQRVNAAASAMGAGALAVSAFAFPSQLLVQALATGVSLVWGTKSVRDVYQAFRDSASRSREIESSPLILLYEAYEKSRTHRRDGVY